MGIIYLVCFYVFKVVEIEHPVLPIKVFIFSSLGLLRPGPSHHFPHLGPWLYWYLPAGTEEGHEKRRTLVVPT